MSEAGVEDINQVREGRRGGWRREGEKERRGEGEKERRREKEKEREGESLQLRGACVGFIHYFTIPRFPHHHFTVTSLSLH